MDQTEIFTSCRSNFGLKSKDILWTSFQEYFPPESITDFLKVVCISVVGCEGERIRLSKYWQPSNYY